MITFTILAVIAIIIAVILLAVLGAIGAGVLVVFGDLAAFALIMWAIIKIIKKIRKK